MTPQCGGTEGKAAPGREDERGKASTRMARKSRQMPVKKKEKKERRKCLVLLEKIHCRASQEVPGGLISLVWVYILIVCLLWFLPEGIENLIVQLWKGF